MNLEQTIQRTPEEQAAIVAEKIVGAIPPHKPEEGPAKAAPKYERRGPVKFKSPVETSKTGQVFDGDIDFSRLSDRQLKTFRKMVRAQAQIYAKEYELGERAKDKAEFKKVQILMHSVIGKANKTKLRSVILSIAFGVAAILELGIILAITLAPRHP